MDDRPVGPIVTYACEAETDTTGRLATTNPTPDGSVDPPPDGSHTLRPRRPRRPAPTITACYEFVGDVPEAKQADILRRIATVVRDALPDREAQPPEPTRDVRNYWTSIQHPATVTRTAARSGRGT